MSDIIVAVDGQNYVVDRNAIKAWLASNAKVFASQGTTFNEYKTIDDEGRTILHG